MAQQKTPHTLPVVRALPALRAALAAGNSILSAPPGSGKTTRVPLALLEESWLAGRRILMLEPRRLAARTAARFMATNLGEAVGDTVGYRVRLDSRVSARTRIEVVTEGVLTRRLQQDPELDGVGLVVFDEFHERSLQADLGLALCLDVQGGLRDDLRLLVMSATLELEPLRRLFDDARLVRAEGRSFPVTTHYDPGPVGESPARAALRGVLRALREGDGDVLTFLPGAAEIRDTAMLLGERLKESGLQICPLYGDLDSRSQDRAMRPAPDGRRRVVLATSIAETSLTIEGVNLVVDTGWSRVPRFAPNTGLTRLVTVRVSQAAADQRRGRAGRLGPGTCYRLWPETLTLNRHSDAEIVQADLAPLVLELALWGVENPQALSWIDAPPKSAHVQARALLQRLEALDSGGRITPVGRRMAGLPVHPRLAHMLLRANEAGGLSRAADLAAVLSERDILRPNRNGSRSRDLEDRLAGLAAWRRSGHLCPDTVDAQACRRVNKVSRQLQSMVTKEGSREPENGLSVGALVALAYPDRAAQRRSASSPGYLMANGRGALLAEDDPLSLSPFLAIAAMDAGKREGRVFLAARIELAELKALFADRITDTEQVSWDSERRRVSARRESRIDALVLEREALPRPSAALLQSTLLQGIRREGIECLPWDRAARTLQARMVCLGHWDPDGGWPDFSDPALLRELDQWLAPWLEGISGIAQLRGLDLTGILKHRLGWERLRLLDELAPERIQVPSGSRCALQYAPGEPPILAVRLQEMFGLRDTPRLCRGRIPVVLHLLSPARRPIQITRDLSGFWDRTYTDVRKELKGRYPKHYWPEDPLSAVATAKVRPRT